MQKMSELENDGHPHLSSFSENGRFTCSSPFSLEPSETDVTLEVDFEDSWQDAEKTSETDFKVILKDDRRDVQEQSKVELNFEDLEQKNPVKSKDLSDRTLPEKSLKNELSCPEDGEVVETDETSADLEEGEIKETPNVKSVETYNCRYYQMGFCVYGKDCRFFHVSDKGLYSMFDLSVSEKKVHHPTQFIFKQKDVSVPPVFEVEKTSWDQALKEAMDRIESKKKVALGRENLRMTIQSGGCTDEKLSSKEFPPKNSFSRTLVYKTRGSSLSRRKTAYEISPARAKSSARDRIDTRCTFIKRSKTPRDVRWSPKSVSCSSESRSRSRSSSARLSSNCSCTASPKRGRRILSSSVTKSYSRKYDSSSSKSSSTGYASKTGSRRFKRRKRECSSHFKSSKTSDCRSPVKIFLPKRLEKEKCRLSRRDIPRRVIPPKSQVASKSTSSYTRPCDKRCSDMSISPLSNLSNRKDDCIEDFSVVYCSDRNVSDMSISPLSSPSRASNLIEVENYSVSKSKDGDLGKNIIQTGSHNGHASAPQKNISLKISPNRSSNISKRTFETKVKTNPLVMNLVKFHRDFKRDDSVEMVKNMPKIHMKTTASELVDKPYNHVEINKVQQMTNTIQSKLSKKDMLLKRLQEINEAIERKKFT